MPRLTTIELYKEDMKFSAGHFTIFSATERENLHGHNYQVYVSFTVEVNEDAGMSFNYRDVKSMLREICQRIDELLILPGLNKHLRIVETDSHYQVTFNHETMTLLKRDVIVLPIHNVTVEELSAWFLSQLVADRMMSKVQAIEVKILSGPGQSGSAKWGGF